MIDIVIVGDNNQLTKDCITSIEKTTTDYNIIRVDWTGNYHHSLNKGIKLGNNDYVALCNNDLLFTPSWKKEALEALKSFDSVSPICPKFHREVNEIQIGYEVQKHIAGWCIVTSRNLIKDIGYLDCRTKFWGSELLYANQLKQKGYTHALIPNSKVLHLGSQTLNKQPKHIYNRLTFQEARKARQIINRNQLINLY